MILCGKCGTDEPGLRFTQRALCKTCNDERLDRRIAYYRDLEKQAARTVHPAGKGSRYRTSALWRQRPYEFHGHSGEGTNL